MILNYFFNDFESKTIVLIVVPFCSENEKVSKQLLKKLKVYSKAKYDFRILTKTKKVKQLFLGRKNPCASCNTYEGICSCNGNDMVKPNEMLLLVEMNMKIQKMVRK